MLGILLFFKTLLKVDGSISDFKSLADKLEVILASPHVVHESSTPVPGVAPFHHSYIYCPTCAFGNVPEPYSCVEVEFVFNCRAPSCRISPSAIRQAHAPIRRLRASICDSPGARDLLPGLCSSDTNLTEVYSQMIHALDSIRDWWSIDNIPIVGPIFDSLVNMTGLRRPSQALETPVSNDTHPAHVSAEVPSTPRLFAEPPPVPSALSNRIDNTLPKPPTSEQDVVGSIIAPGSQIEYGANAETPGTSTMTPSPDTQSPAPPTTEVLQSTGSPVADAPAIEGLTQPLMPSFVPNPLYQYYMPWPPYYPGVVAPTFQDAGTPVLLNPDEDETPNPLDHRLLAQMLHNVGLGESVVPTEPSRTSILGTNTMNDLSRVMGFQKGEQYQALNVRTATSGLELINAVEMKALEFLMGLSRPLLVVGGVGLASPSDLETLRQKIPEGRAWSRLTEAAQNLDSSSWLPPLSPDTFLPPITPLDTSFPSIPSAPFPLTDTSIPHLSLFGTAPKSPPAAAPPRSLSDILEQLTQLFSPQPSTPLSSDTLPWIPLDGIAGTLPNWFLGAIIGPYAMLYEDLVKIAQETLIRMQLVFDIFADEPIPVTEEGLRLFTERAAEAFRASLAGGKADALKSIALTVEKLPAYVPLPVVDTATLDGTTLGDVLGNLERLPEAFKLVSNEQTRGRRLEETPVDQKPTVLLNPNEFEQPIYSFLQTSSENLPWLPLDSVAASYGSYLADKAGKPGQLISKVAGAWGSASQKIDSVARLFVDPLKSLIPDQNPVQDLSGRNSGQAGYNGVPTDQRSVLDPQTLASSSSTSTISPRIAAQNALGRYPSSSDYSSPQSPFNFPNYGRHNTYGRSDPYAYDPYEAGRYSNVPRPPAPGIFDSMRKNHRPQFSALDEMLDWVPELPAPLAPLWPSSSLRPSQDATSSFINELAGDLSDLPHWIEGLISQGDLKGFTTSSGSTPDSLGVRDFASVSDAEPSGIQTSVSSAPSDDRPSSRRAESAADDETVEIIVELDLTSRSEVEAEETQNHYNTLLNEFGVPLGALLQWLGLPVQPFNAPREPEEGKATRAQSHRESVLPAESLETTSDSDDIGMRHMDSRLITYIDRLMDVIGHGLTNDGDEDEIFSYGHLFQRRLDASMTAQEEFESEHRAYSSAFQNIDEVSATTPRGFLSKNSESMIVDTQGPDMVGLEEDQTAASSAAEEIVTSQGGQENPKIVPEAARDEPSGQESEWVAVPRMPLFTLEDIAANPELLGQAISKYLSEWEKYLGVSMGVQEGVPEPYQNVVEEVLEELDVEMRKVLAQSDSIAPLKLSLPNIDPTKPNMSVKEYLFNALDVLRDTRIANWLEIMDWWRNATGDANLAAPRDTLSMLLLMWEPRRVPVPAQEVGQGSEPQVGEGEDPSSVQQPADVGSVAMGSILPLEFIDTDTERHPELQDASASSELWGIEEAATPSQMLTSDQINADSKDLMALDDIRDAEGLIGMIIEAARSGYEAVKTQINEDSQNWTPLSIPTQSADPEIREVDAEALGEAFNSRAKQGASSFIQRLANAIANGGPDLARQSQEEPAFTEDISALRKGGDPTPPPMAYRHRYPPRPYRYSDGPPYHSYRSDNSYWG